MSCLPQYLQRRGSGIFHLRIVVPVDLRPCLQKREIKRSLDTTDPSTALVLAFQLRKTIADAFDQCRAMKKQNKQPVLKQILYEMSLPDGTRHSLTIKHDDPKEEARIAGELLGKIDAFQAKDSTASTSSGEILSDVFANFVADRAREESWSPKTKESHESTFKMLVQIIGDIPISSLNATHARKFKDTILRLPPNISKNPTYRDMSLQDIADSGSTKVISNDTFNSRITRISSFVGWATRHGHLAINPFQGLTLKTAVRQDEERQIFEESDLEKLFDSTIFKKKKFLHPHYYWLPLLGLFTGARIEELCQLHLDDIHQEDGVWVIDINKNSEDKKLKTLSSKRLIPIHSELLRLGFIDFHQAQVEAGHQRLFPELARARDGYSQSAQKWFNARYRKKQGISEKGKSFHSFRHTAINKLKQLGVDPIKIAELAGHSNDSITTGRYGKRFSPLVLRESINLLSFSISLPAHSWQLTDKSS